MCKVCVSSITLNCNAVTIKKGYSATLKAVVNPSNATNRDVMWNSSNEGVANVCDGVVHANAKGAAVITAIAKDGSGEHSTCKVTVTEDVLVSSINIANSVNTMFVGDSTYLKASVLPENATCKCVSWSSLNEGVATINPESGLVYAKNAGDVRLCATAMDGSGCKAYISIRIVEKVCVSSVTLNCNAVTIKKGCSATLKAIVNPSNATNRDVIWNSSNEGVANVCDGIVHANAKGTAVITAIAKDGSGEHSTCKVTVIEDVLVSSINIANSVNTMFVGDSTYLKASFLPENATCKCVRWSSLNESIATVNPESGLVYAKSAGDVSICAMALDESGCKDYVSIRIAEKVCVSSVTLNCNEIEIKKGYSAVLKATVCPINATNRDVMWNSSNEGVANVCDGIVHANAKGTAIISAYAKDGSGEYSSCKITVTEDVFVTSVKITDAVGKMVEGDSVILHASVYPNNATNKCLIWSSSNESIATVNPESGLVYAKSAGSTIISATAIDGSGTYESFTLKVNQYIPVESVNICVGKSTLAVGETTRLCVSVCPLNATNRNICISVENENVVSINSCGIVHANQVGTTSVAVTTEDGLKVATVFITVVEYSYINEYICESKYFKIDEELYEYLNCSVISAKNFNNYICSMDLLYDTMYDLVGKKPCGGSKISIGTGEYEHAVQFIYPGIPKIHYAIDPEDILGYIEKHPNCWWFYGSAHELGHLFDEGENGVDNADWVFSSEAWGTYKAWLAIEKCGQKIYYDDIGYASPLKYNWDKNLEGHKNAAFRNFLDDNKSGSTEGDDIVYLLNNIIDNYGWCCGWNIFKSVFRSYRDESYNSMFNVEYYPGFNVYQKRVACFLDRCSYFMSQYLGYCVDIKDYWMNETKEQYNKAISKIEFI